MENLMEKYITLSKDFRVAKTPENIGKLYSFLEELKLLENDRQALLILSQVYSLLAFHKSAYDVFVKIADKNNVKDAKKLFTMSELAQSHGDNFIVKNKLKKAVLPKVEKFVLSDFRFVGGETHFNSYKIDKPIVIFGKIFEKPSEFTVFEGVKLDDCINKISDYFKWLSDCKRVLIDFYNNEGDFEDTADDDWYDSLEIYRVLVDINESGNFSATITCGDDFWSDHLLDIEINGKNIETMGYDG
jgi:hypothetical protein